MISARPAVVIAVTATLVTCTAIFVARVRAAPPDPETSASSQWKTVSSTLPDEAVTKLGLAFYLVDQAWKDGESGPSVAVDHKVLSGDGWHYLVDRTPTFWAGDVRTLEWQPCAQVVRGDGTVESCPYLGFTMRDIPRFRQWTRQHVGKQVALCIGEDLIMAPTIKSEIPGHGVIELANLRKQWQLVGPYLKDMPCSEGLALNGMPEHVAGTGRLQFKTSYADGTDAHGQFEFLPFWMVQAEEPAWPALVPTVIDDDGQWTVFNIMPGHWQYQLEGDFVPIKIDLDVKADQDRTINVTVERGGTVAGRVVRGDNGQPVAAAAVQAPPCSTPETTGVDGSFRLFGVRSQSYVLVRAGGLAPAVVPVGRVREGEQVTTPDIKLANGGWISGRVIPEPALPRGVAWKGAVVPLIPHVPEGYPVRPDLAFRIGPLAPGRYRVKALLETDAATPQTSLWTGESSEVAVVSGEETRNVLVKATAAKQH